MLSEQQNIKITNMPVGCITQGSIHLLIKFIYLFHLALQKFRWRNKETDRKSLIIFLFHVKSGYATPITKRQNKKIKTNHLTLITAKNKILSNQTRLPCLAVFNKNH